MFFGRWEPISEPVEVISEFYGGQVFVVKRRLSHFCKRKKPEKNKKMNSMNWLFGWLVGWLVGYSVRWRTVVTTSEFKIKGVTDLAFILRARCGWDYFVQLLWFSSSFPISYNTIFF